MDVLIISASQGKYFHAYLPKFAELGLNVEVNSISGRKVQEVSAIEVEETRHFKNVVLHLGTNNMPHRSETPVIIINRMRRLVKQILEVNPTCQIFISSVLPRQTSNYDFGTDRQRHERAQEYEEHLHRLDYINSKATVTNALMRQEVSTTFPGCCTFIDNDVIFIGRRGLVKRHLLSQDGLHLTPQGATALLGNMLHQVSDRINVKPPLTPCPPPPPSTFQPMPSPSCPDTSKACDTEQSSASTISTILPVIMHGKMSYQDALLCPKPPGKCKPPPLATSKSTILGKTLKPSPSLPQCLPLPTPAPSKIDPYCTFQVIGRRGRINPNSSQSDLEMSSDDDVKSASVYGSGTHLSNSISLTNRFSTFTRSLLCDESKTSQPSASASNLVSPNSCCDAQDFLIPNFIRRRRRRKPRHYKMNLNGKKLKRRKKTEKILRSSQNRIVKNVKNQFEEYDWNEAVEYNSQILAKVASNTETSPESLCEDVKSEMLPCKIAVASNGLTRDDTCDGHKLSTPWNQSQGIREMTCVLRSNKMAGGDSSPYNNSPLFEQSICLVASGSISQDDDCFPFSTRNHQCVCISVINIVYVKQISSNIFSQNSIDNVIIAGDSYYRQSKNKLGPSHKEVHLMVEEVDRVVEFNGFEFEINHEWVTEGLYCNKADGLSLVLEDVFSANRDSGYIFLGQRTAVSVWFDSGSYYLFNSHSVNEMNSCCAGGKGRVFKCNSVIELATLLLTNSVTTEGLSEFMATYQIYRILPTCLTGEMEIVDPTSNVMVPESHQQIDPIVQIDLSEDVQCIDDPIPIKKIKLNIPDSFIHDQKLIAKTSVVLKQVSNRILLEKIEYDIRNRLNNCFKGIKINSNDPKLLFKTLVILKDIHKTKQITGRPKKTKIGRPKTSDLTDEEQRNKASGIYNKKNPDINRKTSKTYTDNNPDVNRNAVGTYSDKNPDVGRKTSKTFRDKGSHLPKELRNNGLVAEYSGEKLKMIKLFELKNKSLQSDDCSRCPYCKARLFEEELGKNKKVIPMWCCSNGIALVTLPPLTNELYNNRTFLQSPVKYNNFFAFASLKTDLTAMGITGLKFLKIKGRVYHNVPAYNNSSFKSSNIFIDDGSSDVLDVGDLDEDLIREIYSHLQACNNPFLSEYKRLHSVDAQNARLVFKQTSRSTDGPVLGDTPTSSEVAAYIDYNDTYKYDAKQITVWKEGDKYPYYIFTTSPFLEPMSYPLLYPEGTLGWSTNKLGGNGKKLSLLKYVRCLLLSNDRFSKFNRLSETWLVDMYVRIEDERLSYILRNQTAGLGNEFRTATAEEIEASIQDRQEVERNIFQDETIQGEGGVLPGRVYLPQSFTGSPRYMRKCYMESMGIVSQLGGPTYFLTFTASAQWEEIRLSKHDPRKDQPDVVNRVFYQKFRELLRDIKVVFGKMIYVVWTIEFQMRGLPHAHICFRVQSGQKQGQDIDRVIRADIPKPDEADGRLRMLVLKNMIHGPCGTGFRNDLKCWDSRKQKCEKHFPKHHVDATYIDDKGFAQYRRDRNNRAALEYRGKLMHIDDRWVVPYNPFLLLKYQCHVNLELAAARSVVKYLFKYISKGPSLRRVAVEVVSGQDERENRVNEVEEFVTKRHVGSTDAAWRVLSYDITGREPTVKTLPVHLHGKNCVIFQRGNEENALRESTNLLDIYFNRPNLPEMRNLTYLQFYAEFDVHGSTPHRINSEVWEHPDGKHFITKRQKCRVTRMFWISPRYIEQYYLRMLLSKFPCFGYSNLLELGGLNCKTFQEAAKALGLAEDGSEYIQALDEAFEFMMGSQYRRLFVLLLREGANAVEMWEKFATRLAEDIIKNNPDRSEKWCLDKALLDIDHGLRRHQLSLAQVGLPVVEDTETELMRERYSYNKDDEFQTVETWKHQLSDDQIAVFKYLEELLLSEQSTLNRVIFLDGPGGSGKTLLLRVISSLFRANDKIVICVATTGIAALNLIGGTTAHSMFGLPIDISDNGYWSLTNGSQRAELIKHASLIIYDEAPMAHRSTIELLDRSLRDLMNNNSPFGGKIVIFSGDFRQIPPVLDGTASSLDVVRSSICKSDIWHSVKTIKLTTSHRVVDNSSYNEFLLKLGSAEIEEELFSIAENRFEILVALPLLKYVTTVDELISFVFPEDILKNPEVCAERAILSTLNSNVDEINNKVCGNLDGDFITLYSKDRVLQNRQDYHIDSSLLHLVQVKGVPNHILKLKVGSVCIIMRNLNFDLGLVNGTKVIIERFLKNSIVCSKPNCNKRYVIPRISFTFEIPVDESLKMVRMQYPLKLAYAMTIHKSQGQTLQLVGLDLRTHCFTHGQLYVALSRTRSPENIRLLVPENYIVNGTAHAKNVVYKDLLHRVDEDNDELLSIDEVAKYIHFKTQEHIENAMQENYGFFMIIDTSLRNDRNDDDILTEDEFAQLKVGEAGEALLSQGEKERREEFRNLVDANGDGEADKKDIVMNRGFEN